MPFANSLYYMVYNMRYVIHSTVYSEESQVWARYTSLQENTAVQSRFGPTLKCAICNS